MLTLFRGKARKSEYMQLLYRGTVNSMFVQYGQVIPIVFPEDKEEMIVDRNPDTKNNHELLYEELCSLMEHVMSEANYRYIYLYGNFSVDEIDVLDRLNYKLDGRLNLIASVQDESISNGQIVIEERR